MKNILRKYFDACLHAIAFFIPALLVAMAFSSGHFFVGLVLLIFVLWPLWTILGPKLL